MKTFEDIESITEEQLTALAAMAVIDEEKGGTQGTHKAENSQPGGSSKSDLGALNVESYLNHYGLVFREKDKGNKKIYSLDQCLFDPSHTKDEASIVQDASGKVTYQCFHNSCSNYTWKDARLKISGDDSLAQFCQGYDPNWKPPKKRQPPPPSSNRDNHHEIHESDFMVYSKKGSVNFIPAIMADHLEDHYSPIIHEGKDPDWFYRYSKSGVWKKYPTKAIRKYVRKLLADYATPNKITAAVSTFQDQVFAMEHELQYDPMIINLKNGMLDLNEIMEGKPGKLRPHAPDYMSRAQMPVKYDPKAKCNLWMDKLAEIFADDLGKCDVLQEFFGYCLFPKILFPCAVFQIGVGGNGKGVVERICYSMLGKENISHVSMKRMEKDFGPIEIRDKLLNSCGETETNPMDVTNFKKIASGDEIQAEVKFQGDQKFTPIAKHMISMNDFPGIRDKTDAMFRRIIVLEYNMKFEGKDMDPELAEKLMAELDGIFMWALEGLKRVLKNKRIEIPESVAEAKLRFRTKANNVLLFVSEECKLGEGCRVSPPKLYKRYVTWAEDSKLKPYGKSNFYEQVKLNYPGVKRGRNTEAKKESFEGIGFSDNPSPEPWQI